MNTKGQFIYNFISKAIVQMNLLKNELHAEHTDPNLWNSSWSTQEVPLYVLERWKLKRDGLNVETKILRLQ